MAILTKEKAERLQKILTKRFGRSLSEAELESSYRALVEFAVVLMDLVTDVSTTQKANESQNNNFPLAIRS